MDDLERIEALHRKDEQASRAQDHRALSKLWTADGVTTKSFMDGPETT